MRTARKISAALIAPLLAGSAFAQLSPVIFELEVTSPSGSGVIEVLSSECDWDTDTRTVTWSLDDVVVVNSTIGPPLAAVYLAEVQISYTPRAEVRTSVGLVAGEALTTVRINSPVLDFDPLPAGSAAVRGTVSFNVSDEDSSGFVQMTALGPPGSGSYKAYYDASGTQWKFADLIWRVEVESAPGFPAGQANASDSIPRNGFLSVNKPVDQILWESAFTITPGDAVEVIGTVGTNAPVPFTTCAGDVDRNQTVEFNDLVMVLASYGSCKLIDTDIPYDWRADLDYSGCVNLDDMLEVLGAFGEGCN